MEQWVPVITPRGHVLNGYEVSDRGRLRTYWKQGGPRPGLMARARLRKTSSRLVKGRKTKWQVICLRIGQGKSFTFQVHELVARAFLRPRPSRGHVIVHVNHEFDDNRASNLVWMTKSEAAVHAVAHKPRRPLAKLTPRDVRAIRKSKETAPVLAERYGVEKRAIYNIKWWETWQDVV